MDPPRSDELGGIDRLGALSALLGAESPQQNSLAGWRERLHKLDGALVRSHHGTSQTLF